MVINLCVSRTPKYVEEFVKENNSMLKDIIKMKAQVAETKFNATNEFLQRVTMMLRDPKFIELGVRPEAISAFLASRGKNAGTFKDDYDKIANYMSSYSRKGAEFDDAGKPFESVKYDMTRVLNEAEEVENKLPQFDADSLYDNIEASIESAVSDILAGNTEDWAIVQTARKQMNAMRDAATKEITTSIEHVCRLANGDQSGLSARLTGFISKHPMRAAKLTNLWARHETDLNARIEQRIKQISEMDGKGPLQMASQLYKRVIPKLLAMMITYKTILNFYTDERLRIPGSIIGNMYPEDKIKEQIKHFKNVYAQELAYAFVLGCNKLTADGTAPFDTTSGFNSKPMPYLVPWLMCLLSDTNDMDPLDIKHMRDIIITLETAAKANDYNVFFSRLSDYVMKECKCKHNDAVAGRIAESWSLFNTIEFKEFIDDVSTDTALQQYAGFEKVAPYATYILMQVIKTKGEVLEAFKQSLPSFNTYKPDDVINNKKKREQIISNLHIDEKDDDDTYARAEKLFNTAMPILMAIPQNGQGDIIIAMRAYYAMQLHKMNNVHNFPLLRLKLFKDMCYHPII